MKGEREEVRRNEGNRERGKEEESGKATNNPSGIQQVS